VSVEEAKYLLKVLDQGNIVNSNPSKHNFILLVEDDPAIRDVVAELLELEGFSVKKSENGKVALMNLQTMENLPALILLDLMMPVMDGFEFREEQKKDARLASVPVVVMSADGRINAKMSKLDVSAYVKKPLDIDVFMKTIRDYVH
jgi:DNA-binding response OmpR family regulator